MLSSSYDEDTFFPENVSASNGFRSISEIPDKYRHIFSAYPHFNAVQSKVMNDILYCDESLVVAAPTGSGKTALFELAVISLLMKIEEKNYDGDFKIVYIAPIKALCSERYQEWIEKFSPFGLRVLEITGDTDSSDYNQLQDFNIVITTPEKWDSLTRKWKDNKPLMQSVKLILIDEVHLVGDETRGPTLEAIVSRLKTVKGMMLHNLRMRNATTFQNQEEGSSSENQFIEDFADTPVRFVAASACIPNIEDVAHWLGESDSPAKFYQIGEEMRPVKLKKIVLGYNCAENWSPFRFSITLMYKLKNILLSHSDGKPSLIFCSTRKGVMQVCSVLFKELAFRFTQEQREKLFYAANQLLEKKQKDFIMAGVGYHHAGMPAIDRYLVEDLFRAGFLPILVATSTLAIFVGIPHLIHHYLEKTRKDTALFKNTHSGVFLKSELSICVPNFLYLHDWKAMGVNLPAHLVVIMSTDQFVNGVYQEYSESQILQMIGRAGRPQFDTTAVAVIMTKNSRKEHYERLVEGREILESSLHRHLTEHLNAEVVLHTVTDVAVAMDWIRSTFLYVCAVRRPVRYSLTSGSTTTNKIECKLQELCMREMNALSGCGIVEMDGMDVRPTEMGRLMACYCIAFETMKLFQKVQGSETIIDLIQQISKSSEFLDIQVRVNERKLLNTLNKNRGHECIRYPMAGRIKTREQKINVLIQATFGCLQIQDHSLNQESLKILRIGQRVSKCFSQYVLNCLVKDGKSNIYRLVLSTLRMTKCFSRRLWEDSIFVARQLDGIGVVYAGLLATSGKTSFSALRESNPRDIERILNKAPPFGNDLKDAVNSLPQYQILLEVEDDEIVLKVSMINSDYLRMNSQLDRSSFVTLVVGDSSSNTLLLTENFSDSYILNSGTVVKTINLKKHKDIKEIKVHLVNSKWVGLDVETSKDLRVNYDKSQQSVKDYLQQFAYSQVSSQELNSQSSTIKGTIKNKSTKENIKSSKASNKKTYFEKLKERVEMFHNQSLQKNKPRMSSYDHTQTTIDNCRRESKISYDNVMGKQLDTSSKKRLKNENLCENDNAESYESPYFVAGPNEDSLFSNDDEYITEIQINDDEYQDSCYINTQGSIYFSDVNYNASGLQNDVEYLDYLNQTNSENKETKDSPPLDHEYFSGNFDMEYNEYYEDTDRVMLHVESDFNSSNTPFGTFEDTDATIIATELEDDTESDVYTLKECTLGEIDMPTFDLGEDDLLAEESS